MPNRAKSFTDLTVRSLPEGLHFDGQLPGFGVRVGKNRKTWFVIKGQNRTKVRLGHYPQLSLSGARRAAYLALGSSFAPMTAPTFTEALDAFLAQDRWRPRSKAVINQSLRRNFSWTKQLDKITHQDVLYAIERIEAPSARSHAIKDIRTFFNWCVPRFLNSSPAEGLRAPSLVTRERVLSDDELVKVWREAEQMGTFGVIVRLCILLGQRRGEISAIRPAFIDGQRLTLPSTLTKNSREHSIPLTPLSQELLKACPFSFNGWSKSKARLDRLSGVTGWTLHDLRRTFATNLAALGTPIHVTEKILNHVSGVTGGLTGIYQRHSYWPEQVEAMQEWEAKLQSLVRHVA